MLDFMRGAKRKLIEVKIAEGNRGKEKLDPSLHPQFDRSQIPDPPIRLDGYALEEWYEMMGLIQDAGIMSLPDGRSFAAYCQQYAIWKIAIMEWNASGHKLLVEDRYGKASVNPVISTIESAATKMINYLSHFGLTPATRGKVLVAKENSDPFAEFQKQKAEMRGELHKIAGVTKKA